MISAYDRFFGRPESGGLGRLSTGREGNRLLSVDTVPALPTLLAATPGFPLELLLSAAFRGVGACLSLELPSGRSAGRGDGLGELPFGFEDLSEIDSMRVTFAPAERSSSSAFRLGSVALGRGAGFGDTGGFSPVIDAIKSRIGIVTVAPCACCVVTTEV